MLIKHTQKALIAALFITGSSSMALAGPTAHATYRLKATSAQEFNSQPYQLHYKYRAAATAKNKSAYLERTDKQRTAILVPNRMLSQQPTAPFTVSDKLANQPFAKEIELAAAAAALDPALVHAVIYVESRYRHNAVSPKGAIGLMQLLPDTAARYGVKDPAKSPQLNLKAGTLYLRDLLRMFDNRMDLALAAYNAGEGAVLRYARQIPPYRETQMYVRAVLAKYQEWQSAHPADKLKSDAVVASDDALQFSKPQVEYLAGTRLNLSNTPN